MVVAESRLTVVTGPSRSGKSCWAEHLASASGAPVVYLATAATDGHDASWQERLRRHQSRRPPSWQTLEVGFGLPAHLDALTVDQLALVDSLGTWVAWGLELDHSAWEATCNQLIDSIEHCAARMIVVSEQTGWGVIPPTAVGGLFRDRLGSLEQCLMGQASAAWLVVAGRAIDLFATSVAVPH